MAAPAGDGSRGEQPREETAWQRRRRLAEVFGEVLPQTTSDEREPSSEVTREGGNDAWLRSQVPPHHGS